MIRAAALVLAVIGASAAAAEETSCRYPAGPPGAGVAQDAGDPARAFFVAATERYEHGVLGDAIEAGGLVVQTRRDLATGGCGVSVMLPERAVFEDIAPRLADLDGDGSNEVVVVESDRDEGARIAIYGLRAGRLERIAATAPLGQARRWLAPAGIGDFDGDGRVEIAYVETPHLRKILRVVRLEDGGLREVAAAGGLTNHRIGDPTIAGGSRDCGGGAEIVTADAGWRMVVASRVEQGRMVSRALGPLRGAGSFEDALRCAG